LGDHVTGFMHLI